MSTVIILYVLAALGAVVVALTRLRLKAEGAAGNTEVNRSLLNVHTVCGALGLVGWVLFLVYDKGTFLGGGLFGIISLGLLWVTSLAGLMFLVRWLPARGRHAGSGGQDEWSQGPGLSVLAHVGLLVSVLVDTGAYIFGAV